ncbi:MAG: hypothetical protein FJ220_03670 [Kiritimatiellaceae bacterium]|nr:hypothetical protein [Kiritimatiellaceae bacterium]
MKSMENSSAYRPWVRALLRLRFFPIAAWVFGVAGLVLFGWFTVHQDIPRIQVAEITSEFDRVTVRMSGKVVQTARFTDSGQLGFALSDDTGEIKVVGGRMQAEALASANRLPRYGDRVDVTGCLSVTGHQDHLLCLQSSDDLVLHRNPLAPSYWTGSPVALCDLTPSECGRCVSITGVVKTVEIPVSGSKGIYRIFIEDGGVERTVVLSEEMVQSLDGRLPPPGKLIRAQGRIEMNQQEVQLRVMNAGDFRIVKGSNPIKTRKPSALQPIGDLRVNQQGEVFTVGGILGEPRSIRGGVIYPLMDESGEIPVVLWDKQISGEERAVLDAGLRIRITAPLVVYKGSLELVPADAGGLIIESAL